MKKIYAFILIFLFLFVLLTSFAETADEENVMLANTKGKLHDFVKYVIETEWTMLNKYNKKETISKHLKKKKFPFELEISNEDQIKQLWYFIKFMINYKENIGLCLSEINPKEKIPDNISSELIVLLDKGEKYTKNPPIDEADECFRQIIKGERTLGFYDIHRQKYFYRFNTSLVSKGLAIEQLFMLMRSNENYSNEELSNILKYGLITINKDFLEIPENLKLDELNFSQRTHLNKARTLLIVENRRGMLHRDIKKALAELEKVQ